LLNGYATFLGLTFTLTFIFLFPPITFALTDCPSHRSLISIQRFKNKNLKTIIPRITNTFSSIFIYKKRDERERREKRVKKNKYEIQPSQFQTAITFDRKLRLRHFTWLRKTNDEIYKVYILCHYCHFWCQKILSSNSKTHLKFFSFFFCFFLEIVYIFILLYEQDLCIFE
jgi:hypothetical protein